MGAKLRAEHRGEPSRVWAMLRRPIEDGEDPIRYEFGSAEATVTVRWSGGASLHLVWPSERTTSHSGPYFYLEGHPGAAALSTSFSTISVIPVSTPPDRL